MSPCTFNRLGFDSVAPTMSINQQFRKLFPSLVDSFARNATLRCSAAPLSFGSDRKISTAGIQQLDASKGNRERVVILGSGWAG